MTIITTVNQVVDRKWMKIQRNKIGKIFVIVEDR